MTAAKLMTLDGRTVTVSRETIESLAEKVTGEVCAPGEAGYDDAREIWNAMIDRHPGLVVRCREPGDVVAAIKFAGAQNLLTSIRSGGHNIAGNAVCDGGLMIDLSAMTSIRVDPKTRKGWAGPGVTLADMDRETQAHGLALPIGINSTTGLAGLTLGGGFGWTTRKYGMTVDSLTGANVVTAAGDQLRADKDSHPDLFWALRGGGGNFGVVTEFEFDLHPVGPEVLSGLIVHPIDRAEDLLKAHRDIVADVPDDLTAWAVLRKAPPLPFLPDEWHGKEVIIFALCHVGDMKEGERAVEPYRALGEPIADVVGPHRFADWQQAFDPLLTPGARNYWKSHDFSELSDESISTIVQYANDLPSDETEIFLAHLGGAMSRVPAESTAFPGRDAHFVLNVHTRWQDPSDDETCVGWARSFFDATAPYATGMVYVNFMPEDEGERVRDAYGAHWKRLAKVKADYDPENFFRMNQNIAPAEAVRKAG